MRRARVFTWTGLPLLALLLMAQPGTAQFNIFQPLAPEPAKPAKPAPRKPPPAAQPKPPAAAAQPNQPAPAAAQKKTAPQVTPQATAAKPSPAAQKKTATKKPEPAKHILADYDKVWDVTAATTRKDIVARFGEPQRVGDSERKPFYYFNDALVFYFTAEDTVGTMIVGNSFEPAPPNAIPPDVIDKAYIGRSRDDVLKAFGPATVVSSENYRYMPASGPYKVEFQCYDFKRYVCGQMLVQF